MKSKCKECAQWREAIVALIQSLPSDQRQIVCAKLSTIPTVWRMLSPQDKLQARVVLKLAGYRFADLTSKQPRKEA